MVVNMPDRVLIDGSESGTVDLPCPLCPEDGALGSNLMLPLLPIYNLWGLVVEICMGDPFLVPPSCHFTARNQVY